MTTSNKYSRRASNTSARRKTKFPVLGVEFPGSRVPGVGSLILNFFRGAFLGSDMTPVLIRPVPVA